MRKKILLALLIVLLGFVFAACGEQSTSDADNRTIVDMAGRTVEVPNTIEKVACHSSTCEAAIITLGKASLLAGTTDYVDEASIAYKLFPELSNVDKLADDMSIEEMLQKDVEVVFVKDKDKIDAYEEAGLPVIYVDMDTMEGTKEGIKIIGEVINASENAEKCVDYIEKAENKVAKIISNSEEESFTAYYSRAKYEDSDLLTTYAADHIYAEWIKFCNGNVITKDMELPETKGGVVINSEELVSSNPDVIFIGGYYRVPVYENTMDGKYNTILNAVKNDKVYLVPTSVTDWSAGSCELGLTVLWCAQQVYPDLFEDINMEEEISTFYKEISGIEVSEELVKSILNSEM